MVPFQRCSAAIDFLVFTPFSCQKVIAGSKRVAKIHFVKDKCLTAMSREPESWGRFGSDESPCVKNKLNVTISHPSLLS